MPTRKQFRTLIDNAKRETKQFHVYKLIGITLDGHIVYGAECIAYQRIKNKLLCVINGNWRFRQSKATLRAWWQKGHTTVTYYHPLPK